MSVTNMKRIRLNEILHDAAEQIWTLLSDSHQKGRQWEADMVAMATDRGLTVEPGRGRGDMKIHGMTVQCKHIDAVRCGGSIDISNMRPVEANNGHRGYVAGEYDVLALRHHEHAYMIPAAWLANDDGTLAGRVRLNEIEQFRDGWHVFTDGYLPPSRQKQLLLPVDKEAMDGRQQH